MSDLFGNHIVDFLMRWLICLCLFQPKLPPEGYKFQVGMKLEAIDPLNLSAICVAMVMKVSIRKIIHYHCKELTEYRQ